MLIGTPERRYPSPHHGIGKRSLRLLMPMVVCRSMKNRSAAMAYTIDVNGRAYQVDSPGDTPLLWVIRDLLDLTGTKFGCGIAQCGACTVHLDGDPIRACVLPLAAVGTRKIVTIEAIGTTEAGRRIQAAWLGVDVVQCGYCQSGQIMSAAALLARTPRPSDADIDAAMSGNICRCATYVRIRAAIKQAASGAVAAPQAIPAGADGVRS
jgi:isoquinoline 1-oxidoreductase alpha subunit